MRYNDLNVTFDSPETWKFREEGIKEGKKFTDLWIHDKEFKAIKEKLKEDIHKPIDNAIDYSEEEVQIGERLDPILERLSKSYFLSEDVNQELLVNKANKNTLQKKLQPWCEQLNKNAPIVRKTPGIHVFQNKFKNVPCVIVTAGPSLANAIEHLKAIKQNCLIMAVDTSFRSLTKRGVDPHFVNAHDANANGQNFFKGIETDSIGVFVNYINPLTINAFQGNIAFYYVRDEGVPTYQTMAMACDDENRKDGSFLQSGITGGSSVAHTAMYVSLYLGCNPITFVGLDLSYPNLEKSHFESDNAKSLDGQKLIDAVDLQGRKVKTNLSFYSYKTVFERMAPMMKQVYGVDLFTCTEDENGKPAGIVHAGLRPMPFKNWIDLYASKEREELKQIQEVYKRYGN